MSGEAPVKKRKMSPSNSEDNINFEVPVPPPPPLRSKTDFEWMRFTRTFDQCMGRRNMDETTEECVDEMDQERYERGMAEYTAKCNSRCIATTFPLLDLPSELISHVLSFLGLVERDGVRGLNGRLDRIEAAGSHYFCSSVTIHTHTTWVELRQDPQRRLFYEFGSPQLAAVVRNTAFRHVYYRTEEPDARPHRLQLLQSLNADCIYLTEAIDDALLDAVMENKEAFRCDGLSVGITAAGLMRAITRMRGRLVATRRLQLFMDIRQRGELMQLMREDCERAGRELTICDLVGLEWKLYRDDEVEVIWNDPCWLVVPEDVGLHPDTPMERDGTTWDVVYVWRR